MATPFAASEGVSVAEAALALRVSRSTVQLWLRMGAPAIAPGGCGRGHSARVDLDQLRAWRAARLAGAGVAPTPRVQDFTRLAAAALWKAYTRSIGEDRTSPSWKRHGVRPEAAADFALDVYRAFHREVTGRLPDELPPEMTNILSIGADSIHSRIPNAGGSDDA